MTFMYAKKIVPDGTARFATILPLSNKNDVRLKWVKAYNYHPYSPTSSDKSTFVACTSRFDIYLNAKEMPFSLLLTGIS